jgi:hypothetical protein
VRIVGSVDNVGPLWAQTHDDDSRTCHEPAGSSVTDSAGAGSGSKTVLVHLSARTPISGAVLEAMFRGLKDAAGGATMVVKCVLPDPSQVLHRSLALEKEAAHRDVFDTWCDATALRYAPPQAAKASSSGWGLSSSTPSSAPPADTEGRAQPWADASDASVVVLAGDASSAYGALSRGQPMLFLPFLADQLDMAVRLERLGCGVVVNPVEEQGVAQITAQTARAMERMLNRTSRAPFVRSIQWLRGIIGAGGGAPMAAGHIESVWQHGTEAFVPHHDRLSWYAAWSFDVYAVYAGLLVLVWLVAQTCMSAVGLLWVNLNQADLSG